MEDDESYNSLEDENIDSSAEKEFLASPEANNPSQKTSKENSGKGTSRTTFWVQT